MPTLNPSWNSSPVSQKQRNEPSFPSVKKFATTHEARDRQISRVYQAPAYPYRDYKPVHPHRRSHTAESSLHRTNSETTLRGEALISRIYSAPFKRTVAFASKEDIRVITPSTPSTSSENGD